MWLKICGLLFCVSAAFALEGYQVLQISSPGEHSDIFDNLSERFDFLELHRDGPSRVLVSPEQKEEIVQILAKYNIPYSIAVPDVLKVVEEERAANKFCVDSRLGNQCYWSHTEINNYLDELEREYSQYVSVKQVGRSYEGRPMKTITITNGDGIKNKKVIFVDGGMHAREWISPATAVYTIKQLVENREEHAALLKDFDWVVLPVINADGYEYSRTSTSNRMWRKTRQQHGTCTGADPNRNFPYKFGHAGTSNLSCMDTYRGPQPFSEPECAVLRDVLLSLSGRMKFYLSLHSYGSYILYPYGYDRVIAPNHDELDDVAKAGYDAIKAYSQRQYQIGNAAILLYPAAGASDDYAYAVAGARIAVTMELPAGGAGFDPPPSSIDSYAKESFVGMVAMAKRVMTKYSD